MEEKSEIKMFTVPGIIIALIVLAVCIIGAVKHPFIAFSTNPFIAFILALF